MQKKQKDQKTDRGTCVCCTPGARKEKDGIRFTAAAAPGAEAALILYRKNGEKPVQEIAFPKEAAIGNLRTLKVPGLSWEQYEYQFRIDGRPACDPYARILARTGKKEKESALLPRCGMHFAKYDWDGDVCPQIPWEDAVMYHLHVRNFTRKAGPEICHKGTFLGLAEKIPYLCALGINQVKLMPVYEPAPPRAEPQVYTAKPGERRTNCWGYGNGYYFAPRRLFAATSDPVTEMKDMIRAMHAHGIEVLLEMYFVQGLSARMMTDILTFWVQEYHVDGFHIMGAEKIARFLAADPVFAKTKLLVSDCGGWDMLQGKAPAGEGRMFAECNDGFRTEARRLLKGDEGVLESFAWRARRNGERYGIVNYITNHDGFTLCDLVSYDNRHNDENGEQNRDGCPCDFSWNCGAEGPSRKKAVTALRRRQMKNALLLLLLSQGTPMLLAGDEFANSQSGNNNPWCLDNRISWVDWNACEKNEWLLDFVKKAVAFRKKHRILHMALPLHMTDYRSCGFPDLSYHSSRAWYGGFAYNSRQLGMLYCERYCGRDEALYIAYNLHPQEQELALPTLPGKGKWYRAADTSLEESFLKEEQEIGSDLRSFLFPARSIVILIGKKEM